MYATVDEIRAASPNIAVIADGADEDIERWGAEATVVLNNYCRQKFDFEQQVVKKARYTYYPQVYLPTIISGEVEVYGNLPGEDPELIDNDEELDVEPGTYWLYYSLRNVMNPAFSERVVNLSITADWGFASSVEDLLIRATNSLAAQYNLHIADTDYHLIADVNTQGSTATSLAEVLVMLNSLKDLYNAHIADMDYHDEADTVEVTSPDATDQDTAVTLVEELKARYNKHIASTTYHVAEDSTNRMRLSVDNPIMPDEIITAFMRITQRIAIRDNSEDHRYHNSGYTNESFSDGYSYSLSNPDYRSLIAPNDEMLLNEWRNEGQIGY